MADASDPLSVWAGLAKTFCWIFGEEGSDLDADGVPLVREDLTGAIVYFVASETEASARLIRLASDDGSGQVAINGPTGEVQVTLKPADTESLDLAGAGECGQTPRLDLVWQLVIDRAGDEARMGDYGDLYVLAAINTDPV
ncbi:MAG: hypothetical protein ABF335_03220 [Alphaproteobacteria bacterium]